MAPALGGSWNRSSVFQRGWGAFSIWIAPQVYPLAEQARQAGETHRALVRERLRETLPGRGPADFSQDEEFLQSATEYFRSLERLWDGLQRQQTLASIRHLPQVRRLFLASAVEWALDLYYEVPRGRERGCGRGELLEGGRPGLGRGTARGL